MRVYAFPVFLLIDDLSVEKIEDSVSVDSIVLRVCHHDDSRSFGIQLTEQFHYFETVLGVEVAGRLVGQNQFRFAYHGAGDGYSLLLASG